MPQTATCVTVRKESQDATPVQVSTHARPRTAGRHSVVQPPMLPTAHRPHVPAPLQRGPRPTYAAHPRRQAPPPRTHVVAQTPAVHPRSTCAPIMQERPEHTRPHMHPVGLQKQGFLHMAAVLCNKIEASAHGMGSGGLAVDAMSIGCLVVDRRGERFFVLSHFCLCECEVLALMLETLIKLATTITVVRYYGPNEELGGAHYLAAFAGDAVGLARTALQRLVACPGRNQ
jgi:hypothetical protein